MLFLLILVGWFQPSYGYVCSKTWDMDAQFFKENPEYVMFGLKWNYKWYGRSSLEVFAQNQHRIYTKSLVVCEDSAYKKLVCPAPLQTRLFMLNANTAEVLYIHYEWYNFTEIVKPQITRVVTLERFTLESDELKSEMVSRSRISPLVHCESFDTVVYDPTSDGYFHQGACIDFKGAISCGQYLRDPDNENGEPFNENCEQGGRCGPTLPQCHFDPVTKRMYSAEGVISHDPSFLIYGNLACNFFFGATMEQLANQTSPKMVLVAHRNARLLDSTPVKCFRTPDMKGVYFSNVHLWNTDWTEGECGELGPIDTSLIELTANFTILPLQWSDSPNTMKSLSPINATFSNVTGASKWSDSSPKMKSFITLEPINTSSINANAIVTIPPSQWSDSSLDMLDQTAALKIVIGLLGVIVFILLMIVACLARLLMYPLLARKEFPPPSSDSK